MPTQAPLHPPRAKPFRASLLWLGSLLLCGTTLWSADLEKLADGVLLPLGDRTLKVEVCRPDIIRVACSADKNFLSRQSIISEPRPRGEAAWSLEYPGKDYAELKTAELRVRINLNSGDLRFFDSSGMEILAEKPGSRVLGEPNPMNRGDTSLRQQWLLSATESLFGLGQQQFGKLNIRGLDLELWQHNTNVVVPFLISSKGYGILWDNLSYTRFGDLRDFDLPPASLLVDAEGNPGALTATYFADARFEKVVSRERSSRIDIYSRNTGDKLNKMAHAALPEGDVSIRWEGTLAPTQTGEYNFRTYSDGGLRVWIDGRLMIDHWRQDWLPGEDHARVRLEAGKRHQFRMEWVKDQKATTLRLGMKTPSSEESLSLWSEAGQGLDYYFVQGPDIDKIIAGYRSLTGRATMIPRWAFGLWQSRQRYKTSDQILDTLEGFRSRRIPIDVIVEDWFYWRDGQWGSHEFDTDRFPDAAGMIKQVHEKYNAKLMISVWGKFYPGTENYAELAREGYLYKPNMEIGIKDWLGYPFTYYDPFNPGARKMYWDQINRQLFSKGVDAWWLDATEPDLVPNPQLDLHRVNMNPTFEGPGTRVLNGYALHTCKAVAEGQLSAAPDQRVYILTRSGFAGQQRFSAATWSGDTSSTWTAMRKQIMAGLGFTVSGIPYWTMDIGGFSVPQRFSARDAKPEDIEEWREMNTRWFQFGTFAPIFRVHGEEPFREMWEFGGEQHPAYAAHLRFDKLRYQLMPYIYSLAGAVHLDDATMMRPLVMDFRTEARALAVEDQFMFGPALMVSPVTTHKAREREVYLPSTKGDWYELWSGASAKSGGVTAPAPYDSIPLHVRAGSIIPTGPEIQYTGEKPADPLTLWVYTGANGSFQLYEDDGLSNQYQKAQYSRIRLSWDEAARTLSIGQREGAFKGMLSTRQMRVILVSPKKPVPFAQGAEADKSVTYDGGEQRLQF